MSNCVKNRNRLAFSTIKVASKVISALVVLLLLQTSCKKLVEVPAPTSSLTSDNVYKNDNTAASVFTGIYTEISSSPLLYGSSINSVSIVAGLSADELVLFGGAANSNVNLGQYYINKISPGNTVSPGLAIWTSIYRDLYTVNLALERLEASSALTPAIRQQLIGEGKFLRAFFYFYLVNLYGDLPLVLSSDYRINQNLKRTNQDSVYGQIINDLKEAKNLLIDRFVSADAKTPSIERLRPTRWAANALLARAYLYKKDWLHAEQEASTVINNSGLFGLDSLNGVFLKNSRESIWQLQPVNSGWNTEDARVFILPSSGPTSNSSSSGYPVYLSDHVFNAFESNDQRKTNWVKSVTVTSSSGTGVYRFPFKYKSAKLNSPVTEYETVLRLAEQYLIRAEARANGAGTGLGGAIADLSSIRTRAGLSIYNGPANKDSVLNAIYHERQVELFSEWGHRWMDLKRTNKVDEVMAAISVEKATSWNSNFQWYPIPLFDIVQNPNLIQNAGY